jgi:hypothetical protein
LPREDQMPLREKPTFESKVLTVLERIESRLDSLLKVEILLHALRPDPDQPTQIGPLSWLASMLEYCREHAPEEDEDPDAYWMMVSEVQALHDRLRNAL